MIFRVQVPSSCEDFEIAAEWSGTSVEERRSEHTQMPARTNEAYTHFRIVVPPSNLVSTAEDPRFYSGGTLYCVSTVVSRERPVKQLEMFHRISCGDGPIATTNLRSDESKENERSRLHRERSAVATCVNRADSPPTFYSPKNSKTPDSVRAPIGAESS